MYWRGQEIVNISRDFLDTNGIKQNTNVYVKMPQKGGYFDSFAIEQEEDTFDLKEKWLAMIGDINIACQKGLSERFDSTIGAGTVLMPFGGVHQLTPAEVMAAKLPLTQGDTKTATMMSFGYQPKIFNWSPFHGAVYAVVESLAKIVASGGSYEKARLSFQEYFEKLGKDPEKWGKPFAALIGGFLAQMKLGTARCV